MVWTFRTIRAAAAATAALVLVVSLGCESGKVAAVGDCSKPQTQAITLGLVNGQAVIVSGCDPALVSLAAGNTIQWSGQNGAMIKVEFQSYPGQQPPFLQANCSGTTSSCSSGSINSAATQNFSYKYWFWVGSVKSADPSVIIKP